MLEMTSPSTVTLADLTRWSTQRMVVVGDEGKEGEVRSVGKRTP